MTVNLNDRMEIDHPIEVHADGSVTDVANVWAPELYDDELSSDKWEFFSAGYSGQDRYRGPIMHDSEFIGGGLERDILATPGIYAAIASYYSTDADGDYGEGWAVVRYNG